MTCEEVVGVVKVDVGGRKECGSDSGWVDLEEDTPGYARAGATG